MPHSPEDQDTLDKLERDTRTKKSIVNNGGELFAVELDALFALHPDMFKDLVVDAVNQYFDRDIYDAEMADQTYQEESIRRLVHDRIVKSGL